MTASAKWYTVENESKHVRQVVVQLPADAQVPSRVKGSLIHRPELMMQQQWAGITLFMEGDTPEERGPFIFSKANNVVDFIKGCPGKVAFASYKFRAGGLLQIFVCVDSPEVKARARYPFLTENAHWPENEDTKELIPALLDRKDLDVCFIADTSGAPCQGQFGLRVAIPDDCRAALKGEWEELKKHHFAIPEGSRNRQAAIRQFERENPMEENPVLDQPCSACGGKGKLKCEQCGGQGYLNQCQVCHGKKTVSCTCKQGRAECSECNGSGRKVLLFGLLKPACKQCTGTGTITHADCRGKGVVSCSKCSGKGMVDPCSQCSANGFRTCTQCSGTGRI